MIATFERWYPEFRHIDAPPNDRYYVAGHVSGNLSTITLSVDQLFAVPLVVPFRTRIDRIGINVLGAAAGNARIGIYSSVGLVNLKPLMLLLDSGELDVSGTGFKTATVSLVLQPDILMWACVHTNAAISIRSVPVAGCYPIFGYDNALDASTSPGTGWLATGVTYAALPPTFPTSTIVSAISGLPAIGYRIQS